jgi:hypothetical protein
MDQSALDRNNYAVCQITDRLAKIAAERGKLCYWNGPYLVELIEHTVGMLAESGPTEGELIKYLTIGNKVCCGLGYSEPQYQRNLINGLWPPAPSQMHARKFRVADESAGFIPIPRELEELHKKYMYLYELYPGKTWMLEPHPVRVKEGLPVNIFKRPNGDYLVPLMSPSHSLKNGAFLKDIEVIVRASDLGKIKGVYARTPDVEGRQFSVPWKFKNNEIKVTLPGSDQRAFFGFRVKSRTQMLCLRHHG